MKKTIFILSIILSTASFAQTNTIKKERKAWEFGLGGGLLQHSRVNFGKITTQPESFITKVNVHQTLLAGNLYIANEITPWLYWDIQGNAGADLVKREGNNRYDKFYYAGPGLQFRFLSNKSKSSYIEPYARVGINYFHKTFKSSYYGTLLSDLKEEYTYNVKDIVNEKRDDKSTFFPFSLGIGLNSWFNNHWGVGLQADYIAAFYDKTPHFPSGTVRLMYRIGGKSKKTSEKVIEYVDRVEYKDRIVEKLVEKPVVERESRRLFVIFENLYFEFDKDVFLSGSEKTLDEIADILKSDEMKGKKFLITAHTDAKGSEEYNLDLSKRRAIATINALEKRGVPADMIKGRGVGKKVSMIPAKEDEEKRVGDRKITIQLISNMAYWNYIPKI